MAGPGAYWFGQEEIDQAVEVVKAGHLFRYGNENDPKFLHKVVTLEKEFSTYCSTKYALATSSGTSALIVAMAGLGLKPGDEIIVPAYTFVASYTSIIFSGYVPVLCEIDDSLTMDPENLKKKITPRTKAIMPVHMLGNPCDMDAIMAIAREHNLKVIEDSCQAAGGSYKGKKLGSIGEVGAFSLNIFKTINSGDGGMMVTNNQQYYETAFGMHDQGHKPMRYGIEIGNRDILGLNFRMNEVTGAISLAQLRKIDDIIQTLRFKRQILKDLLADVEGFKFRTLNDPDGDCATLCTVIFDSREQARYVSEKLMTKTIDQSGWHVYSNMEHVLHHLKSVGQPHEKGCHPVTDDILSRSINISIGVVDGGLGSGWGINIRSTEKEIEEKAKQFIKVCEEYTNQKSRVF